MILKTSCGPSYAASLSHAIADPCWSPSQFAREIGDTGALLNSWSSPGCFHLLGVAEVEKGSIALAALICLAARSESNLPSAELCRAVVIQQWNKLFSWWYSSGVRCCFSSRLFVRWLLFAGCVFSKCLSGAFCLFFRPLQSRPPSLSIPRSNGLQALSASPITVMASYLFLIWCVAPALALAAASILPSVAAELLMVGSYILPWMLYVQMSPGSSGKVDCSTERNSFGHLASKLANSPCEIRKAKYQLNCQG